MIKIEHPQLIQIGDINTKLIDYNKFIEVSMIINRRKQSILFGTLLEFIFKKNNRNFMFSKDPILATCRNGESEIIIGINCENELNFHNVSRFYNVAIMRLINNNQFESINNIHLYSLATSKSRNVDLMPLASIFLRDDILTMTNIVDFWLEFRESIEYSIREMGRNIELPKVQKLRKHQNETLKYLIIGGQHV
jgi:hypothetical protein